MARYIDLDKVEFLKVEGNKEFNHGVDCCINKLLATKIADVVERSEYERVLKLVDYLTQEHDKRVAENKNLQTKIDKAIEEIDFMRQHRAKYITEDNRICIDSGEVLEILKRI